MRAFREFSEKNAMVCKRNQSPFQFSKICARGVFLRPGQLDDYRGGRHQVGGGLYRGSQENTYESFIKLTARILILLLL